MPCTCSEIGIGTPVRRDSSTAETAVRTPSATIVIPERTSPILSPRPTRIPTVRFRERSPVQVRTRSPIPASPANVCGCAPRRTPSREISASPREMRSARALWPNPSPSAIPAAIAITFFSAPPISIPVTSSSA